MESSELIRLRDSYRGELLEGTMPFWQRHAVDRQHGGLLTSLAEDGTVIDTDKAVWLQGRSAWTFATLYRTIEPRRDWLEIAESCQDFLRDHCRGEAGKLYFQVTREGRPLRMRRYAYSECFAAMGAAAIAQIMGDSRLRDEAVADFTRFLHYSVCPGASVPKVNPETRPLRGIAPWMMTLVVAQELRAAFGEITVAGAKLTDWIDRAIAGIERDFYRPEMNAVMEVVATDGSISDHFDGRTLNPGHAIECGWFILHEARLRQGDPRLVRLGAAMIDCMWKRGWDAEHGGFFSFVDLKGLPVQEYVAQMKFWWPHNEAEIAALLALHLTGDAKYATWHRDVREWSRRVFADPAHGEWFGYADRQGRIVTRLKGNMWKGPFHLPRMQLYCAQLTAEMANEAAERKDSAIAR